MTASTVDVLRAARDLYAQAPSHVPYPQAPDFGSHCILTATLAATEGLVSADESGWLACFPADEALREAAGTIALADWNATHSTDEVLEAFDRAIEAEALKVVMA